MSVQSRITRPVFLTGFSAAAVACSLAGTVLAKELPDGLSDPAKRLALAVESHGCKVTDANSAQIEAAAKLQPNEGFGALADLMIEEVLLQEADGSYRLTTGKCSQ